MAPHHMTIVEDVDGNIHFNFREYYNGRVNGVEQDFRDKSLTLMRDRANKGQYYVSSKVCDTTTHWWRSDDVECCNDGYCMGFKNFLKSKVGLSLKYSFCNDLKTLIGCGAFEDSQIQSAEYFLNVLESIIDRPIP